MALFKVYTTDSGAYGYSISGKRVFYKPNIFVGYLDTSLNNSILSWFNVTTKGGYIAFDGTKGLYIEKKDVPDKDVPSWASSSKYKAKYFKSSGDSIDYKKNVFTLPTKSKNTEIPEYGTRKLIPTSGDGNAKSVIAFGSGNDASSSGIGFGSGGGKGDYTKYYIIGGVILLWLIIK